MTPPVSVLDTEHMIAGLHAVVDDLRGARVFLTGGTGFVGTWLMEAIVAANAAYDLGCELVLLTRDAARFHARSPHLARAAGVSFVSGNAATVRFPERPFTHVIHAATERSYTPDAQRPLGILADDERATRRVLAFCADAGVRKLLFTSSGAVYGPQPPDCANVAETDRLAPDTTDPRSVYGQSKRLSEFTCIMHGAAGGFDVTIARLFAFVGPHLPLDEGYAAGNFIRDALAGGPIAVGGDGTPLRSYLYAADLAIWLWHMLVRGRPGRAYNVGSPVPISVADLARAVSACAGEAIPIAFARDAAPGATAQRYVPSTARARSELGLEARVDLPDALRRTFAWHAAMRESRIALIP